MTPDLTASLLLAQRHLGQALVDLHQAKASFGLDAEATPLFTADAQASAALKLLVDLFGCCEGCGDHWLKQELVFRRDKVLCQACAQGAAANGVKR